MAGRIIDLRSDTVTQPTPAMRRAMAEAEVGDDVYREDPTVNRLQEETAELFHREAALFLPSGTMANQIAIRIYLRPGQEVVCEERSHIFSSELGMLAAFAGGLVRPLSAKDGIITWKCIEPRLRRIGMSHGSTGLIALENTMNFAGGTVYPTHVVRDICQQAHKIGLPVYLDGARIFNAAVALNTSVEEVTQGPDSFMFSLSKGLGAPVGSMLLGSLGFIEEARNIRKMLGGAMRQAGVLAAAGLIALREGPYHLHTDHENARCLANGLSDLAGLHLDATKVCTNIVLLDTAALEIRASDLVNRMATESVLANAIGDYLVRLVTHRDVNHQDCERAVRIISGALGISSKPSPRSN